MPHAKDSCQLPALRRPLMDFRYWSVLVGPSQDAEMSTNSKLRECYFRLALTLDNSVNNTVVFSFKGYTCTIFQPLMFPITINFQQDTNHQFVLTKGTKAPTVNGIKKAPDAYLSVYKRRQALLHMGMGVGVEVVDHRFCDENILSH